MGRPTNKKGSGIMDKANKILSDVTVHMKYAKYDEKKERRETWSEICTRNMQMHIKQYPHLSEQIEQVYGEFVFNKKILPSMRSLQFGGKSIEVAPNRIYNCAFMPIDNIASFWESMFLLLGGTGVGYSVQYHHVDNLPEISHPNPKRNRRWLIGDSIEGWADAIKVLIKSYFGKLSSKPVFDFSDIRQKGERLITSGGKAPGPQPLRECLVKVEGILKGINTGDKINPIQAHDIMCHIADAVLAGGIRRAALISLFSADDMDMITSKSGSWWELNPQRGRANNSAVLLRSRIDKEYFMKLWERIENSGSGEPGIYFSNDKDWGTNPCCEIALRPYQFCNLTEINVSDVVSQNDLNSRVVAATILGTLQAGYTDFHYLREVWKTTTEKDSLLGVSMTGIASNNIKGLDLHEAANLAKGVNATIADEIGINHAARITCVKPAGTTSCVLGTSSGIHAWHDDYYIRRVRVGKTEAIYNFLSQSYPQLIEDDYFRPHDTAVISIPQKAPKGSTTREESALDLLNRVKHIATNWVQKGHNNGMNTHNVSATISVRKYEWDDVGNWMWKNRAYYNGLAVLPYDGGTYQQAPFETITRAKYERMMAELEDIDVRNIKEIEDNTDLKGEIACAGGLCEI
jgi:ribonucleoside-triphosphate reductase (thioredoxin)